MIGVWSSEGVWGERPWRERIAAREAPPPRRRLAIAPGPLGEATRRRWREGRETGQRALDALGPALREAARGAAGLARSMRDGAERARLSAAAACRAAPGALGEGARAAVDAAGFGPLRLLVTRHPSLATALGLPVLVSSLLLFAWSGAIAAVLGLWCVATGLVFANQAAREMLGDGAHPTTPSAQETDR